MQLFVLPQKPVDLPGQYVMSTIESQHCARTLRMRPGDRMQLLDGLGGLYEGTLVDADPQKCIVHVQSCLRMDGPSPSLVLAVAPTKNMERFEWMAEKATEIGVTEIVPLLCGHSERKVIRTDRLQKIIESASKQSMQTHFPRVRELVPFRQWTETPFAGAQFIAHAGATTPLTEVATARTPSCILIGPEGDFTPQELDMASRAGYRGVTLGLSRLRTETAAIVACTLLHFAH